jgi:hypothetical protein
MLKTTQYLASSRLLPQIIDANTIDIILEQMGHTVMVLNEQQRISFRNLLEFIFLILNLLIDSGAFANAGYDMNLLTADQIINLYKRTYGEDFPTRFGDTYQLDIKINAFKNAFHQEIAPEVLRDEILRIGQGYQINELLKQRLCKDLANTVLNITYPNSKQQ